MGVVVKFPRRRHARATSSGHKSGRSSDRETPVSRSIGITNSAGTPRLDCVSQYQICPCVVPMRRASLVCPPASSHAFFSASDMSAPYPVLGENQPKSLCETVNLDLSRIPPMKGIDKEAFGRRVKALREDVPLSQPALAKALGVPQQTVGNWETGKVGQPRCINELAEALGTTRDWLLWGKGPERTAVKNPFEQINDLLQGIKPQQAGAVIRFLKTLSETEAA